MAKKLTRTGNSLALILDRDLLAATGIDATTPLMPTRTTITTSER